MQPHMPVAASPPPNRAARVSGHRRRSWTATVVALTLIGVSTTLGGACSRDQPSGDPIAEGRRVYGDKCASCHGADLRGTSRGPSHLSQVYAPDHHGDDAFRAAIANGSRQHHWNFGDMPPILGLSDTQVDDVIAYVRSVQTEEGFEPAPPG